MGLIKYRKFDIPIDVKEEWEKLISCNRPNREKVLLIRIARICNIEIKEFCIESVREYEEQKENGKFFYE